MNRKPTKVIVEILEDYFGKGLQIKEIAEKNNSNQKKIADTINSYLGIANPLKSMLSENRYDYHKRLEFYTSNNLTISKNEEDE